MHHDLALGTNLYITDTAPNNHIAGAYVGIPSHPVLQYFTYN
jgi:hypothetical protein